MSSPEASLLASELAAARSQADRLHRSGSITLLSLAAFWGIAAALYQWADPVTGEIALLLGTVAAHPVAWLVLRLAGGSAFLPRTNPLGGLILTTGVIPVIGVLAAAATAAQRPDAFFAVALLGIASAGIPLAWAYERPGHLLVSAVCVVLPVVAWFLVPALLPWFGLLGIVVLVVAGALLLRRNEAVAAAQQGLTSGPDDAGSAPAHADADAGEEAPDDGATDAAPGPPASGMGPPHDVGHPDDDGPFDQSTPKHP